MSSPSMKICREHGTCFPEGEKCYWCIPKQPPVDMRNEWLVDTDLGEHTSLPKGPIAPVPSPPPVHTWSAPRKDPLTEGVKYDSGKPRMDLLDPYAIEQLSKVLTFGAEKYAAHNWRKGIHKSRLIAAALRHFFKYLGGEDKDPETNLSHIAHAMCCCMFILGLEDKIYLDDRYQEPEMP